MSHYPDEVWTDWARGVMHETLRAEIRDHVASGCSDCRETLAVWERVAHIARQEPSYEPPPHALQRAYALFAQRAPVRTEPTGKVSIAQLVYDSFASPLPEGVRSLERGTRHLSYKAGSFFIDVRIEEAGGSGVASVVGQLMHHPDASTMSLEGLSVVLTSGRATLAETTTNRFGEFTFEMDMERENHLAIGVGDEFAVVVPLSGRRGRA